MKLKGETNMKKIFALLLVLTLVLALSVQAASAEESAPTVYFTADISPEGLQRVYDALNWTPTGKLAVKVSTGEPPASNYLRAELIGPLVQSIGGTIVECNTAYGGSRASSALHKQVAADHGFTSFADFDVVFFQALEIFSLTMGADRTTRMMTTIALYAGRAEDTTLNL